MKTVPPDFLIIFKKLREILLEQASRFTVTADAADHYCLEISHSPKFQKRFPVAWVKISKSYVSFHFMPIYILPQLQKGLSPALKARMHGKSCFNFKAVDEKLFKELRQLTALGFNMSKEMGVV